MWRPQWREIRQHARRQVDLVTALKLDTRQPIFVIVGDFNPAIFSVGWVANNLHGIPIGTEIELTEIMAEVPGGLAQLNFINGVALVVTAGRLDAFVADQSPQRIEAVEQVLVRLMEVLPHTPFRGIGCNFSFADEEPTDVLLSLFDSPEGIEGEYVVRARQYMVQMEVDDALLNLTRATANGAVQFSFNYHRTLANPAEFAAIIPGLVDRSREHSLGLLKSLYQIENYEPVGFLPLVSVENEDGQSSN